MKRILSLLLCVVLLLSATASAIEVRFPDAMTTDDLYTSTEFDPSLFLCDSDSFDLRLARLSLCLAVSAFRSKRQEYADTESNLSAFLRGCGFTNYHSWDYNIKPTDKTVASACAFRTLPDNGLLLAVPVSGQGYENEWMSNFSVGSGSSHEGFSYAANIVYTRVMEYLDAIRPGLRVRVWVTGFSRSAAISNLVGDMLMRSGRFDENDVFVYTFGTPSTTTEATPWPQIHNICNAFDPVPFVPFPNWGYQRHGTTYFLPAREVDPDYDDKLPAFRTQMEALTGQSVKGESDARINWLLARILSLVYHCVPENMYYSDKCQQMIITTYATQGGIGAKLGYLISTLSEDQELLNEISTKGVGGGTLITGSLLTLYSEIAGLSSGHWADSLGNPKELVRQHAPSVYMAWLSSTDDADVLFDHPTSYIRVITSGDVALSIQYANGKPYEHAIPTFTMGGQTYYAVPNGDYTFTLTALKDTTCSVGITECPVDKIADRLFSTTSLHIYTDEQIVLTRDGDAFECTVADSPVPMYLSTDVQSLVGELALTEHSSNVSDAKTLIVSALTVALPHALSIALVLLYMVLMTLWHFIYRMPNHRVYARRNGRILLILVGTLAAMSAVKHLFYFRMYMVEGLPSFESRSMLRASEVLGVSFRLYELFDALLYLFLSVLAFRATYHRMSRIRGRRLSGLLFLTKCVEAFGAILTNTAGLYTFASIGFFLLSVIAFIIVKDAKADKMMWMAWKAQIRKRRRKHGATP